FRLVFCNSSMISACLSSDSSHNFASDRIFRGGGSTLSVWFPFSFSVSVFGSPFSFIHISFVQIAFPVGRAVLCAPPLWWGRVAWGEPVEPPRGRFSRNADVGARPEGPAAWWLWHIAPGLQARPNSKPLGTPRLRGSTPGASATRSHPRNGPPPSASLWALNFGASLELGS